MNIWSMIRELLGVGGAEGEVVGEPCLDARWDLGVPGGELCALGGERMADVSICVGVGAGAGVCT
jgi:hypothetical protein